MFIEQIGIELNLDHVPNFATQTEVLYNIYTERVDEGQILTYNRNWVILVPLSCKTREKQVKILIN